MELRVADNINQLDDDGATISAGRITETQIGNKINDYLRGEVFSMLRAKFPKESMQKTRPLNTYTASSTINAVSGTTLTADDAIFNTSMVGLSGGGTNGHGFEVQNTTDDEKIRIDTYTSTTIVEMASSVAAWSVGGQVYVLGNEFTFGGSLTDLVEITAVELMYQSGDSNYKPAEYRQLRDLFQVGTEIYSTERPYWYRTTVDVSGTPTPAVGILPHPTNYNGEIMITYVERPPELGSSDEPTSRMPEISQVLIYAVTAWALRLKGDDSWKDWYQLYQNALTDAISNYRPSSRVPKRVRSSRLSNAKRVRIV